MWPRPATMRPMGRPAGSPSSATEPCFPAGATGASSFTSWTSTSPSSTRANSSWSQVRHSDVPSARITSSTYSMFLPTATFS